MIQSSLVHNRQLEVRLKLTEDYSTNNFCVLPKALSRCYLTDHFACFLFFQA